MLLGFSILLTFITDALEQTFDEKLYNAFKI